MILDVIQAAKKDVAASHRFYEKQQKGLGDYFLECILNDIAELAKTGGIHRKIRGYHHVNPKRFQSILYYRVTGDTVTVTAIIDGRMDPTKRDRILSRRP